MRSPRFELREPTLRVLFDKGNLRRVWSKKVRNAMRQQFVPDPIDHLDFHHSLASNCRDIESEILSGNYSPSTTRRILQEKSKGLCRQLVIPTLKDALVLQCLSDAMYRDIKNREPTSKAFFEPSDHHFSNTQGVFKNSEYGSFHAWKNFQQEIFRFSRTRDYIVITDIANFYDTIQYQNLRNVISDIAPSVREPVLDMLIYALSGLLWQPDYMPRVEIGLPQINLDAPRILAHCFLYELDSYLENSQGGDFVRFMDDIDVGVDTLAEARTALKCIDLVLQTRHVRLNSGKTQILTSEDAYRHFRVRMNRYLGRLEKHIEARAASNLTLDKARSKVRERVSKLWKQREFDTGNGEKILKRLLGIGRRIGADIPDRILFEILLRRPGARVSALISVAGLPLTNPRARLLLKVVKDPQIVDDATFINIAQHLAETPVLRKQGIDWILQLIPQNMPSTFFGLYAAIWLTSRFSDAQTLYDLVRSTKPQWSADPWLGRLVGGLYPLFINVKGEGDFRTLIMNSHNTDAIEVYEFHDDIRRTAPAFQKAFKYIRAKNNSKRLGLTHSRFMLLLSALGNTGVPLANRQALITAHSDAWADAYYRPLAARASGLPIPVTILSKTPLP